MIFEPAQIRSAVSSGQMTLAQGLAKMDEWKNQGDWLPANGGTETPFVTRTGRKLLYVWQPRSGKHAYLDVNTDVILSDKEAHSALGG